jgi:hypothetical protein
MYTMVIQKVSSTQNSVLVSAICPAHPIHNRRCYFPIAERSTQQSFAALPALQWLAGVGQSPLCGFSTTAGSGLLAPLQEHRFPVTLSGRFYESQSELLSIDSPYHIRR